MYYRDDYHHLYTVPSALLYTHNLIDFISGSAGAISDVGETRNADAIIVYRTHADKLQ